MMEGQVTVVVRRHVKPGREAEYEAWLDRLTKAAHQEAPGYLGAEFNRPAAIGGAYRSVFRFDTLSHLEAFESSDLRARMLSEAAPMFAADAVWVQMTGLEFWFDAPPGTRVPQPSPQRMALVLVVVVFLLVLALDVTLGPAMADWPPSLRIFVTVTIQVGLMTYVIMPRLTRLLAPFIYPTTRTI